MRGRSAGPPTRCTGGVSGRTLKPAEEARTILIERLGQSVRSMTIGAQLLPLTPRCADRLFLIGRGRDSHRYDEIEGSRRVKAGWLTCKAPRESERLPRSAPLSIRNARQAMGAGVQSGRRHGKSRYRHHGPNRLAGKREPEKMAATLGDVEKLCRDTAKNTAKRRIPPIEQGRRHRRLHRGGRREEGRRHRDRSAGYTTTSVAILDAILAVGCRRSRFTSPTSTRARNFRQKSRVSKAARAVICGFGVEAMRCHCRPRIPREDEEVDSCSAARSKSTPH